MTAEILSLYMRVRITVENMERGKKKRRGVERRRGGTARDATGRQKGGENKTRSESGRAGNAEYIIPRKKMNHTADGISTTECDGRSNL